MAEEACIICGGGRSEHGYGISRHEFTTTPGDLNVQPPPEKLPNKPASNAEAGLLRLVEVLLAKNILSSNDVFYVVGVKPRHLNEETK